ncbi:hypothetical protein L873DRAFT_1059340 [Choiromyces venosus 120613-1]|uniref:Uncharacterized protein n=1 Tax=Choiromyces venosus 120613-1 TaxID=1336337 RepID=A0A3N4JIV0_9PEZI|nr:hypothetical protein L873DRAFT_1059340 [Choiromyces venosus 120613-1]
MIPTLPHLTKSTNTTYGTISTVLSDSWMATLSIMTRGRGLNMRGAERVFIMYLSLLVSPVSYEQERPSQHRTHSLSHSTHAAELKPDTLYSTAQYSITGDQLTYLRNIPSYKLLLYISLKKKRKKRNSHCTVYATLWYGSALVFTFEEVRCGIDTGAVRLWWVGFGI